MSTTTRAFAVLAVLLSVFYYRSGYVLTNSILTLSPLPKGYISTGNFDTDCKDIGTPSTPEIASCEDAAFWDIHDTSGKLTNRHVVLGCDPNRHNWNTVMGPLRNPNPRATLWIYTEESTTTTTTTNSKSPRTKETKPSILDKIRGTVNKNIPIHQETTTSTSTKTILQKLELQNYPEGHDFHPLGIEIWPSYGGNNSYLYAVNHARKRTYIEQFLLDPSNLNIATYIRTITHPLFISPNALALTSPNSFYVSNDHLFTRRLPIIGKFIPITETLLGLPFSFVSHVTLNPPPSSSSSSSSTDSPTTTETEIETPTIQSHKIVAPFIPFSNGVSLSPGGTELAIASTTLNTIFIYNRNPQTNSLTLKSSIPVPFCPDNIRYYSPESHDDENSKLIVAGHPHFPSVVKVAAKEEGAVGQSWVISIGKTKVGAGAGGGGGVGGGDDNKVESDSNEEKENEEKKRVTLTYDKSAPFSASLKVPIRLIPKEYEIKTIFQSNGTGFSTGCTGLLDSFTGNFYITGLYAPQGAMVCKPSSSIIKET